MGDQLTILDHPSSLSAQAAQVWVDFMGDNATGTVGDSFYPFRTIDAALDATAALPIVVVRIGVGVFDAPTISKIRSNLSFVGAKQPFPTADRTNLEGGTIIYGQVALGPGTSQVRTNIVFKDIGIDVGQDWEDTINGGNPANFALLASAFDLNSNLVLQNFTALGSLVPGATGHNIDIEQCDGFFASGIYAVGGSHAFVAKTINTRITDVYIWMPATGVFDGIHFSPRASTANWILSNAHIQGNGAGIGININGNSSFQTKGIIVDNCVVDYVATGIYLTVNTDASGVIRQNRISNCYISNSTGGIGLSGWSTNATVQDNDIVDCYVYNSTTSGIDITTATGNRIINCVVDTCVDGYRQISTATNNQLINCKAISNISSAIRNFTSGTYLQVYGSWISTSNTSQVAGSGSDGIVFYTPELLTSATDVGNVGTGEDDLKTWTITNLKPLRDSFEMTAFGIFAANANNKRIRAYIQSTLVYDSTAQAQNGGVWRVTIRAVKRSSVEWHTYVEVDMPGSLSNTSVFTYSNAGSVSSVTYKITAEATADNDVIMKSGYGTHSPRGN